MAAKAIVAQPVGFFVENGNYVLDLGVVVTDGGTKWYTQIRVRATASAMKPITPSWQAIIRDAIIAQAQAELGLAVDEVMFPDFTVLGPP